MIGNSQAMYEVKRKLYTISLVSEANILITGETGTGKEVVAKTIHEMSTRRNSLFVSINCSGIPKELVENELFGHKKGAYSQAYNNRKGLVDEAAGGTLFLDEIDSLPLDVQPKLLRLLQEKEYRAIGDNRLIKADVRFIAASTANLEECIRNKTFRSDLYYRLSIFHMYLPPLRDRKDDILLLVEHFVKQLCKIYAKRNLQVSEEALECLMNYNWPGNVRELEHAVHRAVVGCADTELLPQHFDLPNNMSKQDGLDLCKSYHAQKRKILNNFEAEYVYNLLKKYKGNVTSAARSARIDRRSMQRLMSKHNIKRNF
jgi:two-component system response regulator GlrR